MKKSGWMQRHVRDPFVQKAVKAGYRSRAAFKLMQIHEKEGLFKKGHWIIDLGATPGGWAQVVSKLVGSTGRVIALDRLPLIPIPGVIFIQGDFLADSTLETLRAVCPPKGVDWVISDMSPNLSGISDSDEARMAELNEATLALSLRLLKPKGGLLLKMFQGSGFKAFQTLLQQHFNKVKTYKPDASRAESREVYLLAQGFKVV